MEGFEYPIEKKIKKNIEIEEEDEGSQYNYDEEEKNGDEEYILQAIKEVKLKYL